MIKKRKILVLENSTAFSGALKSIAQVINFLSDEFEFYILSPNKSLVKNNIRKAKVINYKFHVLRKNLSAIFYIFFLLRDTFKVNKIIKEEDIEIVHVNDIYNLVGILIKFIKPEIKLIYHIRLLPTSYTALLYNIYLKLIFKYANVVVCVSKAVYESIPDSSKKIIIYDSINFSLSDSKKTIKTTGTLKLFYLANYVKGKGQDMALRVFKKLLQKDKNLILIFAGHTFNKEKNLKYKNSLEENVKRSGIDRNVIFKGFVGDVEKEIKCADAVINFSESESFSMVCLESLIYKTPLFALNSGGPAELIIPDTTGILFSKLTSSEEMSTKILSVIRNKEKMNSLSENGFNYVIKKYSIESAGNKLKNIYKSV